MAHLFKLWTDNVEKKTGGQAHGYTSNDADNSFCIRIEPYGENAAGFTGYVLKLAPKEVRRIARQIGEHLDREGKPELGQASEPQPAGSGSSRSGDSALVEARRLADALRPFAELGWAYQQISPRDDSSWAATDPTVKIQIGATLQHGWTITVAQFRAAGDAYNRWLAEHPEVQQHGERK